MYRRTGGAFEWIPACAGITAGAILEDCDALPIRHPCIVGDGAGHVRCIGELAALSSGSRPAPGWRPGGILEDCDALPIRHPCIVGDGAGHVRCIGELAALSSGSRPAPG